MGRFLSPDPSGLYYADPTNPQSLNLYSYALNNPLTKTDPTGLYCYYGDTGGGAQNAADVQDSSQFDSGEKKCRLCNSKRSICPQVSPGFHALVPRFPCTNVRSNSRSSNEAHAAHHHFLGVYAVSLHCGCCTEQAG
jgi:hypothetical protein